MEFLGDKDSDEYLSFYKQLIQKPKKRDVFLKLLGQHSDYYKDTLSRNFEPKLEEGEEKTFTEKSPVDVSDSLKQSITMSLDEFNELFSQEVKSGLTQDNVSEKKQAAGHVNRVNLNRDYLALIEERLNDLKGKIEQLSHTIKIFQKLRLI